jgi:DNA-binding beta-propeller fold protein YncE
MKFATSCCTFDTDRILVADTLSHKIKIVEVREKGKSKTFIGKGKSGTSLNELSYPQGIVFDRSSRNIIVADTGNNRILIIDENGKDIREMTINFDAII